MANQEKSSKQEYLDMVQNIQEILRKVEKEKEIVEKDFTELNERYYKLNEQYQNLKRQSADLNTDHKKFLEELDNIRLENENLNEQRDNLNKTNQEQKQKIKKLQQQLEKEIENNEKQKNEKFEDLLQKNEMLELKLKNYMNTQMTQADVNNVQQERIEGLTQERNRLQEEFDLLESNHKKLQLKFDDVQQIGDELQDKYQQLKEKYEQDIQKIEIKYKNQLMEKEQQLSMLQQSRANVLAVQYDQDDEYKLGINDENDFDFNQSQNNSQFEDDISYNRNTTKMRIPVSNRMVNLHESFETEEQENYNFQNTNNNYLREIEEKDKEISKLNQRIIDMQEQNVDKNNLQKLNVELEKYKLENKHLLEKIETIQKNTSIEVNMLKKQMEEDQIGFVSSKQILLVEIQRAQDDNLVLIKRQKNLKYQIKLYEDQIAEHNKRINT